VYSLLVGLGGLVWASFTITEADLPPFWYPPDIADRVGFARAATMHDCSYLGGFIGILTASVYLIVKKWSLR
jgi:hypothetical protein